GEDYQGFAVEVIFNANQTNVTVVVPMIINDCLDETNETILLHLERVTGGATLGPRRDAVMTIQDDDSGGVIGFSAANFTVNETNEFALITLTRTIGTACEVTVDFTTEDGTAEGGFDYEPVFTTVSFDAGQTSLQILVPIYDDFEAEGNETVHLILSEPTGGARLGSVSNATLTI